jgi:DNA-binding PadR family transcriptional regulator
MNGNAELSTLELAVIGMIAAEPRSGYDLKKLFEETPLGNFSSSPGAIYPALGRLRKRGLIEGRDENTDSLRPRRVYHVTDAGRAALREEFERSITREDIARRMDHIQLRFALLSACGAGGLAGPMLEQIADRVDDYCRELEAQLERMPESPLDTGRLAMRQGLAQYRAVGRWARRTSEILAKGAEQ